MPEPSKTRWVALAQLVRPQGRRGELLAEPLSDLADLFVAGQPVWLAPTAAATPPHPGPASSLTLQSHWTPTGKNAGRIVLKLSGCDSITAAEALAGQQLMVPSDRLPPLDPNTFFVADLLGCTLFDGDTLIGPVVDVHFATSPDGRTRLPDAAPLLAVQPPGEAAGPALIPFVSIWLDEVDVEAKRICMRLPPGLLGPDL